MIISDKQINFHKSSILTKLLLKFSFSENCICCEQLVVEVFPYKEDRRKSTGE